MICSGEKGKVYSGSFAGSGRRFRRRDEAYKVTRFLRNNMFPLANGFKGMCRVRMFALCRTGVFRLRVGYASQGGGYRQVVLFSEVFHAYMLACSR